MLWDHSNQPFVASVMKGLREGFWPFDSRDWSNCNPDPLETYATDDADMEATYQIVPG